MFLDLKFHDIPNTVAKACEAASRLGVWMLNVHASGGLAMMQAAREGVNKSGHDPLLIAVTVLTSLDQDDLASIGVRASPATQVERLTALARESGIDGIVCSGAEVAAARADLVVEGDDVDVLKFPVPRHHELDKARFIGTADCVMTQDPDSGWFNLGAYRSQVYDGKTVGCQITEGKHGRIHRDKYFERGQPMKVVILCGQDPLLFMLSSTAFDGLHSTLPWG